MDEKEFDLAAEKTLLHLETRISEIDDALEVEFSMGVLSIEFANGKKFVINSHRAARQIWMSAHATAWHFDYNGEAWIASKTDEELFSVVNQHLGQEMNQPVCITMN